jgi:hypothetical protein
VCMWGMNDFCCVFSYRDVRDIYVEKVRKNHGNKLYRNGK